MGNFWSRQFGMLKNKCRVFLSPYQHRNAEGPFTCHLSGKFQYPINYFDFAGIGQASYADQLGTGQRRDFVHVDHAPKHAAVKLAGQVLFLAMLAMPCFAQGSLSLYQVMAPASEQFNNTNPRYNAWTVMYNYSGSGSFSIEFDCAQDATVAGGTPTPGSYAACTNTITGSNPSTTPNYGYVTFVGYTPWLKLNLTAISSGDMTAVAVGFTAADPESGGGGSSPCKTSPCIIAGSSSGAVSLSAATDVKLVAGTSGKKTYLTRLTISWDNAATATIRQGTTSSTPCDTSTATIDGPYGNTTVTGLALDYGSDFSALTTTATDLDICLHLSTSVTGGGGVSYTQF
jgi:hypothetical protein